MVRLTSAELNPIPIEPDLFYRLKSSGLTIRRTCLEAIFKAKSGHPGGSLSCVDVLVALYGKILNHDPKNPQWSGRDYFLLSKGHAAPSLYATLAYYGYFDVGLLSSLRTLGSPLQGHPVRGLVPGIECSTGSLGTGFSVSTGIALGLKHDKKSNRVYVLLGDGECQEGIIWEAAMAARHYHLDNLVTIVDRNGLQIDGPTEKVMGLEPFAAKWESFGWNVIEIDGSNLEEILCAFETCVTLKGAPTVIIAYLIKGAGVRFMEHVQKFHGGVPSEAEYRTALSILDEAKKNL